MCTGRFHSQGEGLTLVKRRRSLVSERRCSGSACSAQRCGVWLDAPLCARIKASFSDRLQLSPALKSLPPSAAVKTSHCPQMYFSLWHDASRRSHLQRERGAPPESIDKACQVLAQANRCWLCQLGWHRNGREKKPPLTSRRAQIFSECIAESTLLIIN